MSISHIMSERPHQASTRPEIAWLTIEHALYGCLVLLGAWLRFGWLNLQPLNTLEAGHAWSAWLAVNGSGSSVGLAPDSPLLYTLHTFLFWTVGPGDATARVIPALCGVGAIFLLWYWRAWLGQTTTLLAAVLLTIDPWLTAYSRLADSAMLSLLLAMLTITGMMHVAAQRDNAIAAPVDSRWRTVTALSFGLLLVSGPQAWSLLVVVALFAWFCLPGDYLQTWLRDGRWWTFVACAAVVGATGWLARPEGLGAISTSFTVWLQQITGRGLTEAYSLSWLGWRLLLEQPLLVLFGLGGLGFYGRNYRQQASSNGEPTLYYAAWMRFLTAWLVWGGLLVLLPGRTPLALGLVSLPLLFWAAHGLLLLLQQARDGVAWRENSLLIAILVILLTSFAIWLAALTTNTTFDGTLARTLLIIWVLILLIILAYTLWLDGRQARLATGALLALGLLAWTVSGNWQLNQRFDTAFPDGFFASYTNPDVRQLAANVQMLSAQRRGDAGELPVQVEMVGSPDPVLGWYLRDMRNLAWVLAPGLVDGQSPPLVITLSEESAVNQLASSYLGSRYALYDHWLPATVTATEVPAGSSAAELGLGARLQERLNTLWTARWRGLLRWVFYREVPATPPSDTVILWVVAEAPQP